MSRRPATARLATGSRLALLAACVAYGVAGPLGGLHHATSSHVVCPEHAGELIEVAEGGAPAAPESGSAVQAGHAGAEVHEHCALPLHTVSGSGAELERTGLFTVPELVLRLGESLPAAPPAVAALLLAPKQSPPRV